MAYFFSLIISKRDKKKYVLHYQEAVVKDICLLNKIIFLSAFLYLPFFGKGSYITRR